MDLIEGQSLDHVLRDVANQGSNPLLAQTVTRAASELPKQTAVASDSAPVTSSNGGGATSSLGDTSAGSRPWFDAMVELIAEVADGLGYAHDRGVIHRDIKPANLMLSREGRLCITDFGLARIVQEPGMTVTGSFLGTPAYMSPEQVAAGRVKLDHRTDVYSLGVVLYEMLTLQRPFPGDSREEVLSAIMTKEPPPPRRLNRKIPQDLETICLKALEKDPDRRYATAAELAHDLRQYLQGGLIAAKRRLPRRAWKAVRRHPVTSTVTVGVVVVALLAGLAQQLWVGRSAERAGRLMAAAEADLRDGTYRQGLEKIEETLTIVPNLPGAQRVRARLLFEDNTDLRELVRVARVFLEADPDDWEAHGWLAFAGASFTGTATYVLGDVDVDGHLAAVERGAPDTAEGWYVRGVVTRSGAESVRCFDRVLELDPGHAVALLWRSIAKRSLRDSAGAIADAQAGIAARPRSTRGRRLVASIYMWILRDRESPHFSDSLLRWLRPVENRRRSHEKATEIRA